jgi:ABC-type multidrug transport system fused ATPase/permease subunit
MRDAKELGGAEGDVQQVGLWQFLWPLIKPYKGLVLGALSLSAFHGIAITFQTLTPKYLIDDVLLAKGVSEHERYVRLAWLAGAYLFASVVARMLVWHVGYRMFTYVREKVTFGLRQEFFRHVNHLCLRFHLKNASGELFSYLFGSPLGQVQAYFSQFTFGAPGALFILVSSIIWVGTWDWVLTAILLASVTATVLLMQRSQKRIRDLHGDYQKTETSVTGHVADLLRGSRDVKLYAMEARVLADFEDKAWEIGRKSYERDVRAHVEWMKNETLSYVAFAVLCVACAWRYLEGLKNPGQHGITIGEIPVFLATSIQVQGTMTQLFNLATAKGAAQAGVDRISAVLKTASTTPDPIGEERKVPAKGDIVLFGVTFGYTPERPVLKDVNLTIPYGQKVALVGPSGAGKSTITQLLLRLYDPDVGAVLIGGLNIRHCAGPELRHKFGVVPQDPFIFRTTIRDNLTVARGAATDEEIRQACELANAWEFVARMPDGLATKVGEGGSTLSGGQRQRLAIARALLAQPDYFIFDEATSALDTVSEHLVQQAMENAVGDRTTLIIAHRLATVRNCDRILVLANGRVEQDGTYEQLVNAPGLFQQLVQGQELR